MWSKKRHWMAAALIVCSLALSGCGAVQVKVITRNDLNGADVGQVVQAEIEAALGQTSVLEKLVEAQPQSTDALLALGLAYHRDGNPTRAIEALTRALAIDPRKFEALLGRAEAYAAQGKYAEAIADLTAALELEAGNVTTLRRRGDFLQQSGQLSAALDDYRAFMALADPEGEDSELQAWFAAMETALAGGDD